nr:hypothetical protein CFP56_46662 [Quercus suber]
MACTSVVKSSPRSMFSAKAMHTNVRTFPARCRACPHSSSDLTGLGASGDVESAGNPYASQRRCWRSGRMPVKQIADGMIIRPQSTGCYGTCDEAGQNARRRRRARRAELLPADDEIGMGWWLGGRTMMFRARSNAIASRVVFI